MTLTGNPLYTQGPLNRVQGVQNHEFSHKVAFQNSTTDTVAMSKHRQRETWTNYKNDQIAFLAAIIVVFVGVCSFVFSPWCPQLTVDN